MLEKVTILSAKDNNVAMTPNHEGKLENVTLEGLGT